MRRGVRVRQRGLRQLDGDPRRRPALRQGVRARRRPRRRGRAHPGADLRAAVLGADPRRPGRAPRASTPSTTTSASSPTRPACSSRRPAATASCSAAGRPRPSRSCAPTARRSAWPSSSPTTSSTSRPTPTTAARSRAPTCARASTRSPCCASGPWPTRPTRRTRVCSSCSTATCPTDDAALAEALGAAAAAPGPRAGPRRDVCRRPRGAGPARPAARQRRQGGPAGPRPLRRRPRRLTRPHAHQRSTSTERTATRSGRGDRRAGPGVTRVPQRSRSGGGVTLGRVQGMHRRLSPPVAARLSAATADLPGPLAVVDLDAFDAQRRHARRARRRHADPHRDEVAAQPAPHRARARPRRLRGPHVLRRARGAVVGPRRPRRTSSSPTRASTCRP